MTRKNYITGVVLMTSLLALGGCSASVTTNTNKSANAAPAANTANKPANAATNANSNSAAKPAAPTTKLTDAKKPEGEKGKVAKQIEVPKDWIDVYDSAKGYSFSVPEGTTGGQETQEGVDTFAAMTPAPSEIGVVVIAFKDKKMTKEDLLDVAVKFMEGQGQKITVGKLVGESDDYSLAEATGVSPDGAKSKAKVLVGTDVTDNYVMIVGGDEAKFAANEKIIDQIWGSFEMWSGGASAAK